MSLIVGYVVVVSVISAVSTLAIRKRDLYAEIVDDRLHNATYDVRREYVQ